MVRLHQLSANNGGIIFFGFQVRLAQKRKPKKNEYFGIIIIEELNYFGHFFQVNSTLDNENVEPLVHV